MESSLIIKALIHEVSWYLFVFTSPLIPSVLNWECYLAEADLVNGCKTIVAAHKKNLTDISRARCSFCRWTKNIKALKKTQSTVPNLRPDLILSSSTTRVLRNRVFVPICQPSDTSMHNKLKSVDNNNYTYFTDYFPARTTWVSRYQRGRTILDFNEARDDGMQWHQPLHFAPDR